MKYGAELLTAPTSARSGSTTAPYSAAEHAVKKSSPRLIDYPSSMPSPEVCEEEVTMNEIEDTAVISPAAVQ